MQNTHSDFYWLSSYFETALSSELWTSITVAISEHALLGGEHELLAERIAEQMAPALLIEIRKYAAERGGRRRCLPASSAGRGTWY